MVNQFKGGGQGLQKCLNRLQCTIPLCCPLTFIFKRPQILDICVVFGPSMKVNKLRNSHVFLLAYSFYKELCRQQ